MSSSACRSDGPVVWLNVDGFLTADAGLAAAATAVADVGRDDDTDDDDDDDDEAGDGAGATTGAEEDKLSEDTLGVSRSVSNTPTADPAADFLLAACGRGAVVAVAVAVAVAVTAAGAASPLGAFLAFFSFFLTGAVLASADEPSSMGGTGTGPLGAHSRRSYLARM